MTKKEEAIKVIKEKSIELSSLYNSQIKIEVNVQPDKKGAKVSIKEENL